MRPHKFVSAAAIFIFLSLPVHGLADRATELAEKAPFIQRERCEGVENFRQCHLEYEAGCSTSPNPRYDAYLNFLKNQLPEPTLKPMRFLSKEDFRGLDKRTPADLRKGNHGTHAKALAKLGDGTIYAVIGYMYYATVTKSPETTNYQLTGEDNSDFHIGIGFDPELAKKLSAKKKLKDDEMDELKKKSVVVEMTPHYRDRYQKTWTFGRVRAQAGKQVKVIGQLMVDNEHIDKKDNCAHSEAEDTCWRLSAWELHPVIEFFVCFQEKATCVGNSANCKKIHELL